MHTAAKLSKPQRGVATLVVILVMMLAISGITLYTAQTSMMEQKVSSNDYRAKQLAEAAEAGIDYALNWLSLYQPNWGTLGPDYEQDTNSISTTVGNFNVSVTVRRPVADPKKVTIYSTAAETGNANFQSRSQVTIVQKSSVGVGPNSAIMINGCILNSTGTPNVANSMGAGNTDILSNGAGGCANNTGAFSDADDGTVDVDATGAYSSAAEEVFGMTLAELLQLAAVDPNVYRVSEPNTWNPPSTPMGSTSQPVIVIMDNCPKLNGSFDLYGVVYFSRACTGAGESPGWGNATVHGSVIFEGNVANLNANSVVEYDPAVIAAFADLNFGIKNRVPGSWIDG